MVAEESQIKKRELSSPLKINQIPIYFYNHFSNNTQPPKISVIMPAFNEEKAVGILIDRIQKVLQKVTKNYEIIIIDDGSKDQTLNICREKYVTLIHNRYNWGKGYALREGFKYARGEIIITIDSDGEHKPEEIPLLIQPLLDGKVEVVLGTRFTNNGKILVTSATNTVGNKIFNFLIRWLTNYKFTDTQCGFRAFKRDCLSKLDFQAFGYNIETEMIVKLARHNIPYCEVPVSSPVSTIRKSNLMWLKDGLKILYTIFKTRLRNSSRK
ncbi:MAG: glycosyltransferase family 2 protein [Promethearchaeota archaeon]